MTLIGLIRVSTDKQNTRRQHDALDPICWKVFEEKISGTLATENRPVLLEALSHVRPGDMLTIQEVDRLGRNLLEGLIVLNDLFQRGIAGRFSSRSAGSTHSPARWKPSASAPTALTRLSFVESATTDGSESTMPRPLT